MNAKRWVVKGHFRCGKAGCHILWIMCFYTESVIAFDMFPSGIFTDVNVKQYITGHCTILSHNAYCVAINWKNCSISEVLVPTPKRESFSFVRLPLYPQTQSPWCGLGHWSQWEKMISFSLSHVSLVPPALLFCVFFSFFFYCALSCLSLLFSLSLYLSAVLSPKTLWTTSLYAQTFGNFFFFFYIKLKVFLRLLNKLNSAHWYWYTQSPVILQLDKLGPQSTPMKKEQQQPSNIYWLPNEDTQWMERLKFHLADKSI